MSARHGRRCTGPLAVGGLLAAAVLAACFLAPTESSMGPAQRIMYVHVPVAWLGLLGFVVMEGSGLVYLVRRDLKWDHWSQAAGELAWLGCSLTLVTGSLWARTAWGAWWEWDPRLTAAFILWAVCTTILLIRMSVQDPHRRARAAAVLSILGGLDVPFVVMAARWFRGLHPVAVEMPPLMRITLLISVAAFTALFVWLAGRRRVQLGLKSLAAEEQRQLPAADARDPDAVGARREWASVETRSAGRLRSSVERRSGRNRRRGRLSVPAASETPDSKAA